MVDPSGLDGLDAQLREGLTVSLLAAVVLAALDLEDDDLLRAVLSHDLGHDLGARHVGLADLGGVAADHEDLVELDGATHVSRELLDTEAVALAHSVLLAARLDDCVHESSRKRLSPTKAGQGRAF